MTRSGQVEIAQRLNLSQATVSRALRNRAGIRPEVRARVLSAAREIGYVMRNVEDGGPGSAEQGTFVGVLVHAADDRWRRSGYFLGMSEVSPALNVTPCVHHVANENCDEILDPRCQPPLMRSGAIRGLVFMLRWPPRIVAELSQRYMCVSLHHEYPGANADVVGVHSVRAMQDLMRHMYDLGHRRIGFFGHSPSFSWAENRFDGYIVACARLGVEGYRSEQVIEVAPPEMEGRDRAGDPWTAYLDAAYEQTRAGITAWVAASDYLGYQLWRGLLARGLRVPRDVSITGFDVSDYGDFGGGKLTSVLTPSRQMGAAALSLAQRRRLDALGSRTTLLLDATLQIGDSTGPVPSRA